MVKNLDTPNPSVGSRWEKNLQIQSARAGAERERERETEKQKSLAVRSCRKHARTRGYGDTNAERERDGNVKVARVFIY